MCKNQRLFRPLTAGLVTLGLVGGWAASAQGSTDYAYASQTISGLTISPTGTLSNLSTSTQDSTTANGSGSANFAPLDVVEAYQGSAPPAPQNFFSRYAPGAVPVSPVGNFTRGDAVISNPGSAANSASVVAESLITTGSPGTPSSETGASGFSLGFSFTPSVTGALTISYNFSNDLYAFTSGTGASALASYHFSTTIKDSSGTIVFDTATANTNTGLVAPPQGGEVIRSGTESVTTGSLTAGTTYNVILSSSAQSSVTIPEPATLGMLSLSGLLFLRRRRR